MRIGVYCGSFAPVHNGHIGIVKQAIAEKAVAKVIIVPTPDYWYKKIAIPLAVRLKCLKLFECETILIDDDPNDTTARYTYDLMELLKKKYPEDELCLIVGADNLPKFNEWVNAQYLLDSYPFVVMNREGFNVEEDMERLRKKDYTVLNCANFDVSSTYIREHLNEPALLEGKVDPRIIKILKEEA